MVAVAELVLRRRDRVRLHALHRHLHVLERLARAVVGGRALVEARVERRDELVRSVLVAADDRAGAQVERAKVGVDAVRVREVELGEVARELGGRHVGRDGFWAAERTER